MNRCKLLIGLCILTLLACDRADDTTPSGDVPKQVSNVELSAEEILSKVDSTYASCRSYSDTGLVKTVFARESGGFTDDKPFKTAFLRDGEFRYEFTSKPTYVPGVEERRFIVWANGDDVQTWWDIDPGVKKDKTLPLALATATGVSGGSSHTVPVMLLPKRVGGMKRTALRDLERLKDADENTDENNVPCFRVKGQPLSAKSQPITLWISKETFLIHRIDSSMKLPKTEEHDVINTTTTTTYSPRINVDIKRGELAFDAPEDG